MNKTTITLFLFIILPFLVFTQVDKLAEQIDTIAQRHLEEDEIVGLSIAIVSHNEVIFSNGYGAKTIGTTQTIDSLTNFLTASISKLFTATAIMQLHEQGKIDLNAKLTDYIPEFVMKDERYKEITIYHLLTHTSGLANYFKPNFIKPIDDSHALTDFAHKLADKKLKFKPGVSLSYKTYSNTGYDILGLVIERISGQVFSDYMDEHILKPIGMNSSSFFIDRIDEERRSTPHKKSWLTGRVKASHYYPDIPQDKPCGNLNSCAADLCKWMIHNLAIYHNKDYDGLIQQSSLEKMWTTSEAIDNFKISIGLGWWIDESDEYGKYLFHVGNDPGFSAILLLSPQNNFGIVVLCNAMYPMKAVWNEIPFEIIDLFKTEWNNKQTK